MPTETPASARGAGANANPPATSAIRKSFFQFIVLPPSYLTLLQARSFSNYPRSVIFSKLGITGDQQSLTETRVGDAREMRRIVRSIDSPASACDDRAAGQDWTHIKVHFIDEACVQSLTKHVSTAFKQQTCDLSSSQIL